MIRRVISMSTFVFADEECGDGEFGGYLDTVTTALVWYPDEPETVTLTTERADRPGAYAPYDFPRRCLADVLAYGSAVDDDAQLAIGRDDTNPGWVLVNQLDRPPVYARWDDVAAFAEATEAAAPAAAGGEPELETLLRESA